MQTFKKSTKAWKVLAFGLPIAFAISSVDCHRLYASEKDLKVDSTTYRGDKMANGQMVIKADTQIDPYHVKPLLQKQDQTLNDIISGRCLDTEVIFSATVGKPTIDKGLAKQLVEKRIERMKEEEIKKLNKLKEEGKLDELKYEEEIKNLTKRYDIKITIQEINSKPGYPIKNSVHVISAQFERAEKGEVNSIKSKVSDLEGLKGDELIDADIAIASIQKRLDADKLKAVQGTKDVIDLQDSLTVVGGNHKEAVKAAYDKDIADLRNKLSAADTAVATKPENWKTVYNANMDEATKIMKRIDKYQSKVSVASEYKLRYDLLSGKLKEIKANAEKPAVPEVKISTSSAAAVVAEPVKISTATAKKEEEYKIKVTTPTIPVAAVVPAKKEEKVKEEKTKVQVTTPTIKKTELTSPTTAQVIVPVKEKPKEKVVEKKAEEKPKVSEKDAIKALQEDEPYIASLMEDVLANKSALESQPRSKKETEETFGKIKTAFGVQGDIIKTNRMRISIEEWKAEKGKYTIKFQAMK